MEHNGLCPARLQSEEMMSDTSQTSKGQQTYDPPANSGTNTWGSPHAFWLDLPPEIFGNQQGKQDSLIDQSEKPGTKDMDCP